MYIEKIKIDKFRVLEDIEICFQPPGGATADSETGNVVNVIAGVNGSGKTTLLDCLHYTSTYIQTNPYEMNTMAIATKSHLGNGNQVIVVPNEEVAKSVRYLNLNEFKDGHSKSKFGFELSWQCPEINGFNNEIKNKFALEFNNLQDKIYYFSFAWFVKELSKTGSFRGNMLEYVEKVIATFILDAERKSDKPVSQRQADAVAKFNDIFKDVIVSSKLESVEYAGVNHKVFFSGTDETTMSLKELSDGEKSLYLTVGNLMGLDLYGKVILIDEPEVALHPAWQQKIMQIYSRIGKNNQFIVATHSPQIIASVPYKNRILLRKENGKIQPVSMIQPPSGVDVNSILSEIMGADPRPPELLKLYAQYRKFVEQRKENTPEALAVKAQLSEESDHSQFMQEMNFLIELRDL